MAKGSLLHWGPIVALSIITTLFFGSIYSSLVWWPPVNISGVINIILILIFLCCILYNFIKAAWLGPGHIPLQWKPANIKEQKLMQFCNICNGYKAPRSHHCRQCNRCVMKMDHHCPWINNCVGHYNHKRFTLFLFFVVIGCSYVSYTLIGCVLQLFMINYNLFKEFVQKAHTTEVINKLVNQIIKGNPIAYRELLKTQLLPFEFYHVLAIVFCIGLDIGVVLAVGILLYYQLCDIINNASSIESWIINKSSYRSKKDAVFVYPYDLGTSENIKQVLHFSGDYIGDGFSWPVKKGCNQYTLTAEQLRQKQIKKHYSVEYCAIEEYNGSFCGCWQGLKVCLSCPWNMEMRMIFNKGDHITVTRWRKRWLYGYKIEDNKNVGDPQKGWFPRKCAVRIEDGDENQEKKSKQE